MELRYLGFDQQKNARTFRFDVVAAGEAKREVEVKADLSLFLAQRIAIQEGPTLCAQKLASDLDRGVDGAHELTEADLRAYSHARMLAEAQKAETRKAASAAGRTNSPWRRQPY
jgi:hypothetical protein